MNKIPLRINIHLSTPIVLPNHSIHLDSLLAEVVAKELYGYDMDRWQNQNEHVEMPLPLGRTEGNKPVWKASIGFSSSLQREYQDFWTKRTYQDFAPYSAENIVWPAGVIGEKISPSILKEITLEKATGPFNKSNKGGFKSYYENRNLLLTDTLIFHAVGNLQETQRLLNKLEAVGKKTAIGYGQIKKVEVVTTSEDYSLFTPDNKAARNLPVEDFQPLHAQMIASRTTSPYWSKRNLVLCYAPSAPIPYWKWDETKQAVPSFEDSWFDEEEADWFDEE